MPVGNARLNRSRFPLTRAAYSCGLAMLIFLFGAKSLQNAIADGEMRTISMHQVHTGETITITYKRDGRYVELALEKIDWFLRDWRRDEEIRIDPHLIDLVWEVQRETGAKAPIDVICGYRSPQTNAMLRRRSSGVARFSQHMLGHAMDFYIPGVPLEELRVIGLRMQRGGVGFYPTSGSPFVHMDTGGVRMWPRMTRDQLLHVFPDGRTVYVPNDSRPLQGYALALADLKKRGQKPTESRFEEAREDGVDVDEVTGRDEHAHFNPLAKLAQLFGAKPNQRRDDRGATTLAAARPPAPPGPPAPPALAAAPAPASALFAALMREAKARQEAASRAAAQIRQQAAAFASAVTLPKLIEVGDFTAVPAAAPAPAAQPPDDSAADADLTPKQIITARGYWEGPQASEPAPRQSMAVVAEAADTTGAISPWSNENRAAAELPLGYAEQAAGDAPSSTRAIAATAGVTAPQPDRALARRAIIAPPATTIALERTEGEAASVVVPPPTPIPRPLRAPDMQAENPWLFAVLISPSVRHYLTTLRLGAQDFRTLAPLVRRPKSAVLMTFAAEANPGLSADRFSGNAIVFVATVTYDNHTASLAVRTATAAVNDPKSVRFPPLLAAPDRVWGKLKRESRVARSQKRAIKIGSI